MPVETPTSNSAFVLGLDGVPWNLLEKWAAAGELPNFARLFEDGAAGPLQSTTPATTPLAWPSIATGVWPDKHGLYGFQKLRSSYSHEMNLSSDVRQPELWDVLSPAVVGNVPMTYPADDIDGTMVTGMMTPQMNDGFTHPPEFADAIAEHIPEYRIGLDWNEYRGKETEFVDELETLVQARRALMRQLMETDDWRLFFFVYTEPDRLQHLIWEESALLDHYRTLDSILGEVIEYVAERDANLFVLSDHGFGPVSKVISLNSVLEQEGYLNRKDDTGTRGTFSQLGLTKSRVSNALEGIGIDDAALAKHLPRSLVSLLASQIPGDHGLYDVDYTNTAAFVHAATNLYINDTNRFEQGAVAPSNVASLKSELKATFESLSDPETGERVLDVFDGDELFPTDPRSPDLVLEGKPGYKTRTTLTDDVFSTTESMAAYHESEGVFLGWGPDVDAGVRPTDASVVDVAPTILHAMGEPIPKNTDGRVLQEIYAPESVASTRSVATKDYATADDAATTDEDLGDVEDRLKGLGYME